MKKLLSLVLAVVMALAVALPAGCAEEGAGGYVPGDAESVIDLCVDGDTAYLLYDSGNVVKQSLISGEAALLGGVLCTRWLSDEAKIDAQDVAIDRLFVKDGALWGTSVARGGLYRLADESGIFSPELQAAKLDITPEGEDSTTRLVTSLFEQDGYLYVTGINASNNQYACRVSLETGARQDFKVKPYLMAPWSDGLVLAYMFDLQTMLTATSIEDYGKPVEFAIFDPAHDETKTAFQTTIDSTYGGYAVTAMCTDGKAAFYKAGARVYAMDMQTGETHLSAYTGDGMLGSNIGGSVARYWNGNMLTNEGSGIKRLVLESASAEGGVLRIFGEFGTDAHRAFTQKHPEISVDVSGEYTADIEKLTQTIVADTDTFDVLVLNYSQMPVDRLVMKGYCQPLDGFAEIMSRVDRMVPKYVEGLYTDGHLYAAPCGLTASGMCYNTRMWEQLGLTEADVPTTYQELFDFLANYVYDYGEDNPDIPVFDFGVARQLMYSQFINQYIEYCVLNGGEIRFDTPVFRKLMQGFAAIDFDELTRTTGEDTTYYNPDSLINLYSIYSELSASSDDKKPLIVAMDDGESPFVSYTLTVLAINPRTKLMDEAVLYVSEYMDNLSATSANLTLYADNNEPVLTSGYEQQKAQLEEFIETQKTSLEAAADENKAEIRQKLEDSEKALEEFDKYKYSVSPERIAEYRETIEPLMQTHKQTIFVGGSTEGVAEINSLLFAFLDGDMEIDKLVKELDSRVRLMELEDK